MFGTGMAALHAAFFTILNPGDHAIVSNVVYMRVAGLFDERVPRQARHRGRLRRHHRPRRRPRRRTTQHPARAHRGHRQPRPPRRRRRCPGADRPRRRRAAHHRLHLHPAADDAAPRPRRRPRHPLAHEVLQRSRRRDGRRRHRQTATSSRRRAPARCGTPAARSHPFNAWLIMRGSTTLPLRLQRQCENAQAVAEFLEADPRVVHVSLPGTARPRPARSRAHPAVRRVRRGRVVRPRVARTRTGSGSSTTCASSPLRSPWDTTRRSSPTRSTPKARPPPSPSRSASTAWSGSPSASKPQRTSSPTSTRP